MVAYNHPLIWKAIKGIQVEANKLTTKIVQTNIGNPPKRNRKRVYIQQQERLRQLYLDYEIMKCRKPRQKKANKKENEA